AAGRLAGAGLVVVYLRDVREPRLSAAGAARPQLGGGFGADELAPLVRVGRAEQLVQRHLDIAVPGLAVRERELGALDDRVDEVRAPAVTQLEAVEQRELLQEDRPLAPRPRLRDLPAAIGPHDRLLARPAPRGWNVTDW